MVFFLVIGAYTVQAQPYPALTQLNGKWLKLSGSITGWTVTAHYADVDPEKYSASLNNMYACVYYDPESVRADLTVRDKNGTQIGTGVLYYDGGTVNQWLGYIDVFVDSKGNYAANGYDTSVYAPILAKIKDGAEKGSINGFGTNGYIENDDKYGYFAGKIKAKIVDKVPWEGFCFGYMPL